MSKRPYSMANREAAKVASCVCEGCGDVFNIRAARLTVGEGRYCSRECSNRHQARNASSNPNWRGGLEKPCIVCGGLFWVKPSAAERRKTCSKPCISKHFEQSGQYRDEKNPAWKGGATVKAKGIRRSGEYHRWRKAVKLRDKVCVHCGSSDELHVDHIKSFASNPGHRFDLNNGRVLCAPCHRKTPTWAKGAWKDGPVNVDDWSAS